MTPVDLVLVEGFKREPCDKLEIHRPALGKPLMCRDDPDIVAVASDVKLDGLEVPCLALDDIAGITAFIVAHCRLEVVHGATER